MSEVMPGTRIAALNWYDDPVPDDCCLHVCAECQEPFTCTVVDEDCQIYKGAADPKCGECRKADQ